MLSTPDHESSSEVLKDEEQNIALLVVDHGSKRSEANDMLVDITNMIQSRTENPVYFAHMELAAPSINDGVQSCVQGGAKHIVVVPFFLSPGRHATTDIPQLTAEAIKGFPEVSYEVRPPIGTHPGIIDVILDRAGLIESKPS
ncbi:Sirohydrochlorin ferrochelatase, chloroplastic [Gracilariopsis chorda]|uniref:Sirohydrochlorin ferrochelatase, chloroplastic n=1 Tax=Gracilariopsis chorda TaxID=448386 RepID=A0A2V3J2Y6_9FLOR|nr:Sirohydrochlorin ferrochelatase, chloroplastic [Gracilariopsis chorda]|eukprot:PXF48472.1 Sirohydrochlorin ferrochelatase, chloroplastic [Gracilariopsis chorda]